jgi:hypothetical protein
MKLTTPFSRILPRFEHHLGNVLPLWAPSYSGKDNQVIKYCYEYVTKNTKRHITVDKFNNLVIYPLVDSPDGKSRAIVAHTDHVGGSIKDIRQHQQSIKYNAYVNAVYNASGEHPMGGDDKVGVAYCLAALDIRPDLYIFLVADEEVGCVGSGSGEFPQVDFAIQLDRRGSNDIVFSIGGTSICSETTAKYIHNLVPHRDPVGGGSTDVRELVSRGIVGSAINMSCGYYSPHSASEYLLMNDVHRAVADATTILYGLTGDMIVPTSKSEKIITSKSNFTSNYSGSNYCKPKKFSNRVISQDSFTEYNQSTLKSIERSHKVEEVRSSVAIMPKPVEPEEVIDLSHYTKNDWKVLKFKAISKESAYCFNCNTIITENESYAITKEGTVCGLCCLALSYEEIMGEDINV